MVTTAILKLLIKKSSRMSRGRMFRMKFEVLNIDRLILCSQSVKHVNFILNVVWNLAQLR